MAGSSPLLVHRFARWQLTSCVLGRAACARVPRDGEEFLRPCILNEHAAIHHYGLWNIELRLDALKFDIRRPDHLAPFFVFSR
jgi:hypothetical protein